VIEKLDKDMTGRGWVDKVWLGVFGLVVSFEGILSRVERGVGLYGLYCV